MPGLLGVVGRTHSQDSDRRFAAVFAAMNRGGRLLSETQVESEKGWALGRVHLGVLQPKPQLGSRRPVHVLFHGELVNEDELQTILEKAGEPRADGAAAIVEGLYRIHKQRFGRLLKGTFCAAIVDDMAGAVADFRRGGCRKNDGRVEIENSAASPAVRLGLRNPKN